MEPWGTPTLTGYSCEDFPCRTTKSCLLLRKEEIRPNIWPKIPEDLCLWWRPICFTHIKCYKSSSPRPSKSPSNSIRYNYQKICSSSKRTKTILWIRKNATFFQVITNPVIYTFSKDFTNHRKMTNKAAVFCHTFFPNILKYRNHLLDLPTLWKTTFLQKNIEEFS